MDGLYFTDSGPVAQSVEQRIENPCVGGSIPPQATNPRRPTVLSWAFTFSFGASPEHAECGAFLRVPTPSVTWGGIDPQIDNSLNL